MTNQGKGRPDLITTYGENSPFAEAYRVLRISVLQWHQNGHSLRSLGITGARPQHGSTTVAANLGLIMGETGKRTILVDGDLYKPSLHQVFKISNEVGLSSILQGQAEVDRALQDVTRGHHRRRRAAATADPPRLKVLPAGPGVKNPAALLQPESLKPILDQLRGLTDFLIVDLPSVSAVAYTSSVVSLFDGLLVVVRAGTNSAGVDSIIKTRLQGANVVGVVFNELPVYGNEAASYRRYYAEAKTR